MVHIIQPYPDVRRKQSSEDGARSQYVGPQGVHVEVVVYTGELTTALTTRRLRLDPGEMAEVPVRQASYQVAVNRAGLAVPVRHVLVRARSALDSCFKPRQKKKPQSQLLLTGKGQRE